MAPSRSRGSSPARTTLDFPVPEPPDHEHQPARGARRRRGGRGSPRRPRSRPKKSAASASSKARRPLYGLTGGGRGAGAARGEHVQHHRHQLGHRTGPAATAASRDIAAIRRRAPSSAPKCPHVVGRRTDRRRRARSRTGTAGRRRRRARCSSTRVRATSPASAAAISAAPIRRVSSTQLVVAQPAAVEAVGERPAAEAPHHQVGATRLAPVVDDRHDRLVAQGSHPVGGGLEARARSAGSSDHLRTDEPDHDLALDPREVGDAHGAVVARAEPLAEAVAAERRPGRLLHEQLRVVGEDPLLELPERRTGIEAELLHHRGAVVLEGAERIGLPAGAVEGEHELRPHALAQRVLAREGLDLGDEVCRAATRQLRCEELLLGREPQLAEALRLRLRPLLVGELGVGVAAPVAERLAQHGGGADRIASRREHPRLARHRLEPRHIEGVVGELELVARRLGHHADPVGAVDHPTDPGDVAPQGGAGGGRRARRRTPRRPAGRPTRRRCGG